MQLILGLSECELHVCIIPIHRLSLVQVEWAPQHVYVQTQISSVLGLSVLSLWGFLTWTTIDENGTRSLEFGRLSFADRRSRVLGTMGCETVA